MKALKKLLPVVLVVIAGIFAYAYRGDLRDWWDAAYAPKLPVARTFGESSNLLGAAVVTPPSPIEGGIATSTNYTLISSPPNAPKPVVADPFDESAPLPEEMNLAVPFMSQAPSGNWDMPYQEACEEASVIMVDAYYRGIKKIPVDQAEKAINALVDYQMKTLGYYKDTNAAETAQFVKGYFGYASVIVKPLTSADQIKRVVANGFPVIVPFAGKQLGNPNFRNGGPLYHMLVIKGYTKDYFITNDPGTRKGADYTYTYKTILSAAHDWNGGDVKNGDPKIIVVIPNTAL